MAKLRLGVIGAGSWTLQLHLPNLDQAPGRGRVRHRQPAKPGPAGQIKDDFGFQKATTDWHDVIEDKPDIVVVGSPPGYHYEQARPPSRPAPT